MFVETIFLVDLSIDWLEHVYDIELAARNQVGKGNPAAGVWRLRLFGWRGRPDLFIHHGHPDGNFLFGNVPHHEVLCKAERPVVR